MPGKVNPVVPEMVNQVAFYVAGADVSVGMAVEAGQLQHNPFEPLIAYSLLTSLRLLDSAARLFARRCVHGIAAEPAVCARHLGGGAALVTALVPLLGLAALSGVAATGSTLAVNSRIGAWLAATGITVAVALTFGLV